MVRVVAGTAPALPRVGPCSSSSGVCQLDAGDDHGGFGERGPRASTAWLSSWEDGARLLFHPMTIHVRSPDAHG
jgi:hypothetical protein